MRNGFKIALILSSFLIFAGCESSSMNNPDDGDENISLPIEEDNSTTPDDGEEDDNNISLPIDDDDEEEEDDNNHEDENISLPIDEEEEEEEDNNQSVKLRCHFIYNEKSNGFIDSSNLVKSTSTDIALGGEWRDDDFSSDNQNYFTLESVDNIEVDAEDVDERLLKYCRDSSEDRDYSNIRYVTDRSSSLYEYPIFTTTESKSISTKADNIFNYTEILRYAYAVNYIYDRDMNGSIAREIFFMDNNISELDMVENNSSDEYLYGVAVETPIVQEENLEREIIIAYRGRDDLNTPLSDRELENAYNFYSRVTEKYPPCRDSYDKDFDDIEVDEECYNVVVTGEGMGALLAIDIGRRTGIRSRVFYGLGDDLLKSYSSKFDTKLRLNSVINFYTEDDDMVNSRGEHFENMVQFPSADGKYNNNIDKIINGILEPIYNGKDIEPTEIYILPNAMLGGGLKRRVELWGEVK